MVNNLKYLKKIVSNNRKHFESLLNEIDNAENQDSKVKIAKEAIAFAVKNSTGYYSSDIIEKVFLDIANQNTISDLSEEYELNSIIHVMTESSYAGGHTRVVERWIELSPSIEKHSLIFTEKEHHEVPVRLINAVKEKGGEVIFLKDSMTDIEKAIELRKIASGYSRVILHIHMHDIVPLIAFGNLQCKRPVIFFNHADHLFWVGVSIADIVADIRIKGQEISISRRKISKSFMLSVPVDFKLSEKIDKTTARKELGLPLDKKIIISIGTYGKFIPVLNINFLDFVKGIFKKDHDIMIIVIGPDYKNFPKWERICRKSKNRFQAIGLIPHEQLRKYIFASDLTVDSMPLGGSTAMLDAISYDRPILTTDNPIGQFDFLLKSDAYCNGLKKLIKKSIEIIYNKDAENKNIQSVKNTLEELNGAANWQANLIRLYEQTPNEHKIHNFTNNPIDNPITFTEIFLQNEVPTIKKSSNRKFYIPHLIEVIREKDDKQKWFRLMIFNKSFRFHIKDLKK